LRKSDYWIFLEECSATVNWIEMYRVRILKTVVSNYLISSVWPAVLDCQTF
jgi:hypothetical protein